MPSLDVTSTALSAGSKVGRVNGQVAVPAGGQLKVPTLRG